MGTCNIFAEKPQGRALNASLSKVLDIWGMCPMFSQGDMILSLKGEG